MRAEFDEEETAAEARSRYLKEMMNIRKVTAEQLSDMTGISKRTLENYVSGRTDPAMGQGLRIALICYVLSMNAYTLGGANDIKPGTPFQSNGRRIVRNTRSFPGPDYGLGLEIQCSKGGIPTATPPNLRAWSHSLPPILYIKHRIPVSS